MAWATKPALVDIKRVLRAETHTVATARWRIPRRAVRCGGALQIAAVMAQSVEVAVRAMSGRKSSHTALDARRDTWCPRLQSSTGDMLSARDSIAAVTTPPPVPACRVSAPARLRDRSAPRQTSPPSPVSRHPRDHLLNAPTTRPPNPIQQSAEARHWWTTPRNGGLPQAKHRPAGALHEFTRNGTASAAMREGPPYNAHATTFAVPVLRSWTQP